MLKSFIRSIAEKQGKTLCSLAPFNQSLTFPENLLVGRMNNCFSCNNDPIIISYVLIEMTPYHFPEPSFNPISNHSISDFFRYGNTISTGFPSPIIGINDHIFPDLLFTLPVYIPVFPILANPTFFHEVERFYSFTYVQGLYADSFSAFGTPPLNNGSAAFGLHPREESMGLFLFPVVRLECNRHFYLL